MTYVIVYRRSSGTVEEKLSFREDDAAGVDEKRLSLERVMALDPDLEIVTLVAADEATLLATHGRYFRTLKQLENALATVDHA